jgi:hypothetical protein
MNEWRIGLSKFFSQGLGKTGRRVASIHGADIDMTTRRCSDGGFDLMLT